MLKVIKKWKKSSPLAYKKFVEIFHELEIHPRTGVGHPEPLKNGKGITYSRRITAQHRIVYNVYDEMVLVLIVELGGHYSDK